MEMIPESPTKMDLTLAADAILLVKPKHCSFHVLNKLVPLLPKLMSQKSKCIFELPWDIQGPFIYLHLQ